MFDSHVSAHLGIDQTGTRGVIEAAQIVGLAMVPPAQRDPVRASTRGIGTLVVEAGARGVRELLLGLGGTGTVDGGLGMRDVIEEARANGAAIPSLTGLVDVDVPLAGARLFIKQKLGSQQGDELIDILDARLLAMFPDEIARVPGAGAAGGLGAAVLALGGRLVPGAAFVMDALHLEQKILAADVVWTGEGRIDEQTVHGKAIATLARRCRAAGVPLVAFCGSSQGDLAALRALGVTEVIAVTPEGQPLAEALARADENLARAARRALTERRRSAGN